MFNHASRLIGSPLNRCSLLSSLDFMISLPLPGAHGSCSVVSSAKIIPCPGPIWENWLVRTNLSWTHRCCVDQMKQLSNTPEMQRLVPMPADSAKKAEESRRIFECYGRSQRAPPLLAGYLAEFVAEILVSPRWAQLSECSATREVAHCEPVKPAG